MAADPDGGTDAAAAQDASADAASAADATTATPDATVTTPSDASGTGEEAASEAGSGGPQYVLPDGALPPYSGGNIYDLLCVPDPGVTFFAFDTVKAPYGDVAGCMAFNRSGHTAAYNCFCQNCLSLQEQCDALPGCRVIQKCELDLGCTSAQTCYLGGGPCVAPINNYGTGSVSTALTQLIATCGQGASPACPSQ